MGSRPTGQCTPKGGVLNRGVAICVRRVWRGCGEESWPAVPGGSQLGCSSFSPHNRRTIHDKMTGVDVKLSDEQVELVNRLQGGQFGDVHFNPYEVRAGLGCGRAALVWVLPQAALWAGGTVAAATPPACLPRSLRSTSSAAR